MATAAATAALPPQPEVHPERIVWVDVETAPDMRYVHDPVTGEPIGQTPIVPEALTDRMADKLREVCDQPDAFGCDGNGCNNVVGWVLDPGHEGAVRFEWSWTAFVQRGRIAIAVCEDCSPSTIYDATQET